MKKLGLAACAIGALLLLGSFGMNTAPEDTYNVGLLQQQMMVFGLGAVLVLSGTIVASIAHALATSGLQREGVPPKGDQ